MKPDSPELFDKKLSMLSDLLSLALIDEGKLNHVGVLLICFSVCSDPVFKAHAALVLLPFMPQIMDIISSDDSILSAFDVATRGLC